MIPGRFHAETFAPFDVAAGVTVTIPLIDQDGNAVFEFVLPIDDTTFAFEISDTSLPSSVLQRPNRAIVDIVRLRHAGPGDDDRTGRSIRAISPPTHTHSPNASVRRDPTGSVTVAGGLSAGASGTSTWADTFSKHEYVNLDDGPFCIRISHNGSGKIVVGKFVVHATNQDAKTIWRLGGFSRWSDGVIR